MQGLFCHKNPKQDNQHPIYNINKLDPNPSKILDTTQGRNRDGIKLHDVGLHSLSAL